MEFLFTPEAISALLTLTFHEIILGIDNIVFISIVVGKLPFSRREKRFSPTTGSGSASDHSSLATVILFSECHSQSFPLARLLRQGFVTAFQRFQTSALVLS